MKLGGLKKMRAISFFILSFINICILGHQASAQTDQKIKSAEYGAFIQNDDFIIIEVESSPAISDWIVENSLEGFSGESYYTWTGEEYLKTTDIGTLTYTIYVTKNGTYLFKLHNRHDCEDATLCNDVWLKVDDGKWIKTFSSENLNWTWKTKQEISSHTYQNAEFVLAKGFHTIQLSARSANFHLDKFVLYPFNLDENLWKDEEETKFVFYEEDKLPPPVPENVSVEKAEKDSIINITWSISRDNIKTAGYNVYINGEKHNQNILSQNEYTFTDVRAYDEYSIRVEAEDWIGNKSETEDFLFQNKTSTNIYKITNLKYTIFPNPTKDVLNIQFTKALIKDLKIDVVDCTGRKLCNKNISKGEISFKIDVSGLQSGIYFVCVTGESKSVFIKQ